MEIERKFIVHPSFLNEAPITKTQVLEQFYTSLKPEVRYRKHGDSGFFITEKGEGDMVRTEKEKNINERKYLKAMEKRQSSIITKVRLDVWQGKYKFECDVFIRPWYPNLIVEIEFPNDTEARDFEPPEGFLEVTTDKRYKNKNISLNGFP